MTRQRRWFLVGLALSGVIGCEDPSGPPGIGGPPPAPAAAVDLGLVSEDCTGCLLDTTLVREAGEVRQIRLAAFGDAKADYVVEVNDLGSPGADESVEVDGQVVIAPRTAGEVGPRSARRTVRLDPWSRLKVHLLGATGSRLRVRVFRGARDVGPEGGLVRAPGRLASVEVPAGALGQSTALQLYAVDSAAVHPRLAQPYALVIRLPDAEPSFGDDTLVVRMPLDPGAPEDGPVDVRVRVSNLPGVDWWAEGLASDGILQIRIPAAGLADLPGGLGSLHSEITFQPEDVRRVGASATASSAASAASSAKALVGSAALTSTYTACSDYPEPSDASWPAGAALRRAPGSREDGTTAIVLVHGWSRDVLDCTRFADRNAMEAGEDYFARFLPSVRAEYGDLTRLLVFTYPTFNDFRDSGEQLAALLDAVAGVDHFVIVGHSMGGLVAREAARRMNETPEGPEVAGIVTLATPHAGAPEAAGNLLYQFLGIAPSSPGKASLRVGLPDPDATRLIAHAGALPVIYLPPPFLSRWCVSSNSDPQLLLAYSFSCGRIFRDNDGVVSVRSALPDYLPSFSRVTWAGYDHSQMKDGKASDLAAGSGSLFGTVLANIRELFRDAGVVLEVPPPPPAWERLSDHPTTGGQYWSSVGLAVANGSLVTVGGSVNPCATTNQTFSAPILSGGTIGAWTRRTDYVRRSNFDSQQLTGAGDRLIGVGGWDCGWYHNAVGSATIDGSGAISPWSGSSFPRTQTGHRTLVSGSFVYAIGGLNVNCPGNGLRNVTYASLTSTGVSGAWLETAQLPATRYNPGAFALADGRLFVLGGFVNCSTTTSTIWMGQRASDGTIGGWASAGTLPRAGAFRYGGVFPLGGSEVLVAISDGGGRTEFFRGTLTGGTLGDWQPLGEGPGDRFAYEYHDGWVYAVGGDSPAVYRRRFH